MNASVDCLYCILKKAGESYGRHETDENKQKAFLKRIFRLVGESPDDMTAPYLTKRVNDLLREECGKIDDYAALKAAFNQIMLDKEKEIGRRIAASGDELLAAIRFALAGNFIDFHAVSDIRREDLDRILAAAPSQAVDPLAYASFRAELQSAKKLVYLHDNAGEIVLDKLLIQTIKKSYPQIRVTCVVRGGPVINDATMEDARAVGLCEVAGVIGSGADIPGTQLDCLSGEARSAVQGADLIVSKGQGNFETLHGCHMNIYYLFLCKCDLFVRRFGLERFTGVFANERSLPAVG